MAPFLPVVVVVVDINSPFQLPELYSLPEGQSMTLSGSSNWQANKLSMQEHIWRYGSNLQLHLDSTKSGNSGFVVLLNTTAKPVQIFSITSASGSSTSQTVSAGQAAKFGLVITPIAAFSGTVALRCTITPAVTPAPTCGLSSATPQIANGTAQPVTVNITTTAPITTSALPHVVFPPEAMPLLWSLLHQDGERRRQSRNAETRNGFK
jgi:hypothetical protein